MSVSIALVRTLVEAVDRATGKGDVFFERANLTPQELEDSEVRIPLERYDELQLLALEVSGDEALGIHMGERASLATFDILGSLSLHAPTLRDAVDVLLRFHRILSDCPDSTLVEEGDRATLRYEYPRSHPRCNQIREEFGLTVLTRIGQAYLGEGAYPLAACFRHAAPEYRGEYTRAFGGAERFDQPYTGLEIERSWLDRPQMHQNPSLFSMLETQALRKLTRIGPRATAADRVRAQLLQEDPAARPNMEAIARKLGMSARSLRRRLTEEQVSFSTLAEETLGAMARELLDDPRRTIHDVAYTMGFSEPSAFHRAFKRWTGLTPKTYRQASSPSHDEE
jgi:AraC-like DNA-binding protein